MAYPQYGWATGPATVNAPAGLNFRSGAGTNYGIYNTMPYGTSLNITGPATQGGGYSWYPVSYGGRTGYVAGQYLTGVPGSAPSPAPAPTPTPAPAPAPQAPPMYPMNPKGTFPTGGTWEAGQYPNTSFNPQGSPYYQGNNSWYYNPDTTYGGDRDWATTPAIGGPGGYLENNPQALFTRFFSPWAGGDDAFSKWTRSQFGNTMQGWEAAFASNPELTYGSYLQDLGPGSFANRWAMMNPQQRGESNSLFGGGRVQWIT
jgi:hypothetical protein